MNIESINSGFPAKPVEPVTAPEEVKQSEAAAQEEGPAEEVSNQAFKSLLDKEVKRSLDKASGLMQTIVSDKMTDKVIRKMPSDEYLQLLTMLDEIISGSVNKEI